MDVSKHDGRLIFKDNGKQVADGDGDGY